MAMAYLLRLAGCEVTLWEFNHEDYECLRKTRTNHAKLLDFRLADDIRITDDLAAAVVERDVVALAISSQHLRSVAAGMAGRVSAYATVVNLSKGIETSTLQRMSEVIAAAAGLSPERIVTLSGPSHAEEVILNMPTTVVAASASDEAATRVQELFSVEHFRVYKSADIIGVELGGALKNIIAIACGIADGLNLGDNTKGALITRGLAEITRLGVALGAQAETFAGLSGIGDMVTTCASRLSRNRYVGEQIGRGRRLDEILSSMTMVAEGIETTRSGLALAEKCSVEVPITEQVHRVLFNDKPAARAVADLMGRKLRQEVWH
jgi:glycerol-3-phosphate dehydrogenase (NAD(P)+)